MRQRTNIRTATVADAADLLEIYRPVIETSAASFELEVPDVDVFARRIATALDGWDWLVAEKDSTPVGYAYGSAHRAREAYRFAVETSVYVADGHHRQGIARALYQQLLKNLKAMGFSVTPAPARPCPTRPASPGSTCPSTTGSMTGLDGNGDHAQPGSTVPNLQVCFSLRASVFHWTDIDSTQRSIFNQTRPVAWGTNVCASCTAEF